MESAASGVATMSSGCNVEQHCFIDDECNDQGLDDSLKDVPISYLQQFNDTCEEVSIWIQRAEDALDLVSHVDHANVLSFFAEFMTNLTQLILKEVKIATKQCVNYAHTVCGESEDVLALMKYFDSVKDLDEVRSCLSKSVEQITQVNKSNRITSFEPIVTRQSSTSDAPQVKIEAAILGTGNLIDCTDIDPGNLIDSTDIDPENLIDSTDVDPGNLIDIEHETSDTSDGEVPVVYNKKKTTRRVQRKTKDRGFYCDICYETFTDKCGLAGHVDTTHLNFENPLICVRCDDERFTSAQQFVKHFEVSHSDVSVRNECVICGKGYKYMIKHLNEHLLKFKCDFCQKNFAQKHLLQTHRRTHTNKKLFSCSVCTRKFPSKKFCKLHEMSHTSRGEVTCTVCNVILKSPKALTYHNLRKHGLEKPHSCKYCSKSFLTYSTLKKHISSHSEECKYQCAFCEKGFATKARLRNHEKAQKCNRHKMALSLKTDDTGCTTTRDDQESATFGSQPNPASDDSLTVAIKEAMNNISKEQIKVELSLEKKPVFENGIQCDICHDNFQTMKDFDHHYKVVHTNEENPLICFKCTSGPNFTSSKEFLEHVAAAHPELPLNICLFCNKREDKRMWWHLKDHQKRFKCEFCGHLFSRKYAMQIHRRIHTNYYPYQCSFCGKKFREPQNCKTHERTHSAEKNFTCDICKQKFKSKDTLKYHQKCMHSTTRQFACEYCGRGFVSKGDLTRHLFVHQRHNRFQCSTCQTCFPSARKLQNHEESSHGRTEGKWQCTQCGKVVNKARKSMHLRAHSGARPYVCEICGKSYAWGGLLREHRMTHMTENPFKCPICNKGFKGSANFAKHKKTHLK